MADNLKIRHKLTNELVPLRLNIAQLRVFNTIELQRNAGVPLRVIVVKARQQGVSTLTEAILFENINRYANKVAQVVAHRLDASQTIFDMSKLFQSEMPPERKLPTEYSNRKEIAYIAPYRSKVEVKTAGKDDIGRGGNVQYFHGSEVAFWPNAKETLAGALQQVPKARETLVVLESTGNGLGGEFYDRFMQAVDRLKRDPTDYTGFLPVFLAWHTFPEYQLSIPDSYKMDLDGEERDIQRKYNLSLEQLYWRRETTKSECGGDDVFFKQEYPADWREAFQSTGRSVFPQRTLDGMANRCKAGRTVEFRGGNPFTDVDRGIDCWQIWQLPHVGHEYTMGIDTMEGLPSDRDNIRSKLDLHGAVIFDRTTGEVACQYYGRGDQHGFGKECLAAARFYCFPWVGPEVPCGMVVLNVFKQANYPKIYARQVHDERQDAEEAEELGWRTTTLTRPLLIESLVNAVRDGSIKLWSQDIIEEMRNFVIDKRGKKTHRAGAHDDLLFALMIALQLHLRCELKPMPYEFDSVFDTDKPHKTEDLAMVGAFDPFVADYGEEETEDNESYF